MIQRFLACWFAFVLAPVLLGAPLKLDTLKVGSITYHNVAVIGWNETDVYFTHKDGIANVKLKYLDAELQQRFGYDPKAAEAAERAQNKDDAAFHESVGQAVAAQAEKRIKAAQEAAANPEDSFADPLFETSLINKPAPKITVGKWLGEVPATDGKAVIVFFWTTTSVPCRKAIAQLNEIQKTFKEKLVVIGISPQPEQEVADFLEPRIEFASAVDPKNRLASAAGVTSVPEVLLIDAKGIVCYVGHPAALDPAKLEKLLAKPLE